LNSQDFTTPQISFEFSGFYYTSNSFYIKPLNTNDRKTHPFQEILSQQKGTGEDRAPLRWGWVFAERTRILSGIQFTTHFIDFFAVQTKRFVGSFVHVIMARQACGQRSSRAAESKRRALGNYFPERICYMILISKCRTEI